MKNNISHLLRWGLCLLLAAAAAGCGNKKPWRVGLSQCSYDVWHSQMTRQMEREASFNDCIDLDVRIAGDRSNLQIQQIDSLVREGVDLLIISPVEADALTPSVLRATKAGIPVVLVDRKVNTTDYTAFIGGDNHQLGHDAAMFLASQLHGKGNVVEFKGLMSTSPARDRHEGFTATIDSLPHMHVAASTGGEWNTRRVNGQVDSLVASGVDFQAVYAHCDSVATAVSRRLRFHGIDSMIVVGIDGLTSPGEGLEAVEHGEIAASFTYPTGGDKVVQLALKILAGEEFEKENTLASTVITANSARLYRLQTEQIKGREARLEELATRLDRSLSRYSMQNYLLASAIAIILLIGALLAVAYRAYSGAKRRGEELAQQKRKLEEQRDHLVSLSKQLQESIQSKLTFFTEVSHDLRTPLTLILAPLEQLREVGGLSPRHREFLDLMENNAHKLQRLVSQTLDFRKFEAGELQLHMSTFDLDTKLREWCMPFRALAAKRLIRFTTDSLPAGSECRFRGDEAKIESIVYNLLSNAFKFTHEGGRIGVRLALGKGEDGCEFYELTVTDSGRGIDEDKIARVFDRFYQADVSHEGSGIGLATVKAYTELHGGTVGVTSTKGKGTCFTLHLPILCEEESPRMPEALLHPADAERELPKTSESPETATPLPIEGGRPVVLVADDNADIRSYVRLLLGNDFLVEEAVDGNDALQRTRRLLPDVVVCDVMMPGMNGWEVCRKIKTQLETSHIPVMLLTACALDEQHVRGFDNGADAYLSKPFNPDVFCSQLRALVRNHRRVKTFLTENATPLAKEAPEAGTLDRNFAERLKEVLQQNLADADFNVDEIGTQMGLSRTQLYRKVKAITGSSPSELLRVMRLRHAAELLSRTNKSVSEVAYECGFANPGYFTRCFKETYGKNPTEWAKGA